MRFAVAALCVLALTGSAGARMLRTGEAGPCDVRLPASIVHPSVKFSIIKATGLEMMIRCGKGAPKGMNPADILGCTFLGPDGSWPVYVLGTLDPKDMKCVISYEMAHMPPNFWADPGMEAPNTIKWLSEQKKASR